MTISDMKIFKQHVNGMQEYLIQKMAEAVRKMEEFSPSQPHKKDFIVDDKRLLYWVKQWENTGVLCNWNARVIKIKNIQRPINYQQI